MKKYIKKNTTKEIVEKIDRTDEVLEYEVGQDAKLLLVLLVRAKNRQNINIVIRLVGAGANAHIVGVVVGGSGSNTTIHTMQEHMAPVTTSNLLVKSVLSGDAQFTYDGGIRVEKPAQKTDAYQRNENLVLSRLAHAESKPSLEILANDVRCTHGATTGTLSKDQLWYLATRGIPFEEGKRLLVEGFLQSAYSKFSDTMQKEIRTYLW